MLGPQDDLLEFSMSDLDSDDQKETKDESNSISKIDQLNQLDPNTANESEETSIENEKVPLLNKHNNLIETPTSPHASVSPNSLNQILTPISPSPDQSASVSGEQSIQETPSKPLKKGRAPIQLPSSIETPPKPQSPESTKPPIPPFPDKKKLTVENNQTEPETKPLSITSKQIESMIMQDVKTVLGTSPLLTDSVNRRINLTYEISETKEFCQTSRVNQLLLFLIC